MKNLMNRLIAATSKAVLFGIGCVMAGLGFAVLGLLALFALAAFGLALLASPLVIARAKEAEADSVAPSEAMTVS